MKMHSFRRFHSFNAYSCTKYSRKPQYKHKITQITVHILRISYMECLLGYTCETYCRKLLPLLKLILTLKSHLLATVSFFYGHLQSLTLSSTHSTSHFTWHTMAHGASHIFSQKNPPPCSAMYHVSF